MSEEMVRVEFSFASEFAADEWFEDLRIARAKAASFDGFKNLVRSKVKHGDDLGTRWDEVQDLLNGFDASVER